MLLGFKKRFKDPILIGTKVFTMRKRRKVRPKIGETIHMYTALRTKYAELITNKEKLMSIQNVRVMIKAKWLAKDLVNYSVRIVVDHRILSKEEILQFVCFDGFKDAQDFCQYWLTDEKGKRKDRVGALMEMYHWTDLKY
jgi:hypothetical protein